MYLSHHKMNHHYFTIKKHSHHHYFTIKKHFKVRNLILKFTVRQVKEERELVKLIEIKKVKLLDHLIRPNNFIINILEGKLLMKKGKDATEEDDIMMVIRAEFTKWQ